MNNKLQLVFSQKDESGKSTYSIENITKKFTKIEKLKDDYETLKKNIDKLKIVVLSKIADQQNSLCESKASYLLLLISKLADIRKNQSQLEILCDIINDEYSILHDMNYENDEVEKAYASFLKFEIELLTKAEKKQLENLTKNGIRDIMEGFGIDAEDDHGLEIDYTQINNPEYMKAFQQKIFEFSQKQQEKVNHREKVKQVENTNIDFQKLYKKLAKIAHPDLAKNASEKSIKELQMQRLTLSWEERNYFELLVIWSEIDPENTIEIDLNLSNRKSIVEQLNKEIRLLESKIYQYKFNNSESVFYYQNFRGTTEKAIQKKIDGYLNVLNKSEIETKQRTKEFKTAANLKKFLKKIEKDRDDDNFSNFFRNFGSNFD
jgi:hypothetical protein